jgi:ABC-2 type transport system permease protein
MRGASSSAVEPTGRAGRIGLLGVHVLTEINGARRSVDYVVGLIVVPAVLYSMFGLPNDSTWVDGDSPYSTIAIASFTAYGVVSLAIFTFVDELAKERSSGWITTMRATPIPLWSHLLAKLGMAGLYSLAIVALLAAVTIPTGASHLDAAAWLAIAALAVVGATAVGAAGVVVAFAVRPRAATAIANLVFLPVAFCSGFFVPLSEVPAFVRGVAPWLPTYHLGRLMWSTTATGAEIDAFTGIDGRSPWVHGAWVAGLVAVGVAACWWVLHRTVDER